ncbi:hypothetical protein J6590_061506 [Homalodisca vitripennis]|nr:hypothetical protein J6590_061506 [Homalodisca vitripennis]
MNDELQPDIFIISEHGFTPENAAQLRIKNRTHPTEYQLATIFNRTKDHTNLLWSVNTPTRVTARSSKVIDNDITNFLEVSVTVLDVAISDHLAQETCGNQVSFPLTQILLRWCDVIVLLDSVQWKRLGSYFLPELHADCGIHCELPLSPSEDSAPAAVDFVVQ